jgi:hypothetical protein
MILKGKRLSSKTGYAGESMMGAEGQGPARVGTSSAINQYPFFGTIAMPNTA